MALRYANLHRKVRLMAFSSQPQIGDRVRVQRAATAPNRGGISAYAGKTGTVVNRDDCPESEEYLTVQVQIDGGRRVWFSPDELQPSYLTDCDPGDEYVSVRKVWRSPLSLTDYPEGMPPQRERTSNLVVNVTADVAGFVAAMEEAAEAVDILEDAVAAWEASQDATRTDPQYHLGYADGYRFRTGNNPFSYPDPETPETSGKRITGCLKDKPKPYAEGFHAGFSTYLDELFHASLAAAAVAGVS